MASRASAQDLLVGSELGHYLVVEKVGAGGMGEVYRARDQHLARDVAIKVLPPGTLADASARKHFHKEALILSQLNHPNVATIYDFDTQQGVDFLVMEYIPGITLNERVASGPLPEKDVLRLGVQLAEGLAAAHEHGVVHRDLKPGNLRLTGDGRLKILDFGLAKLRRPVTATAATESLSEPQGMAGTLPYMAPEQLLGGEIDARTDLHAAGLVLYEMATGRYPFSDVENSQLIGAILHRPPRPSTALNSKLSPELERIIGKCLEKEPEDRYQSAKELVVDLRHVGRDKESGHIAAETPPQAPQRSSFTRHWKPIAAGCGIVIVLLLVAAFWLARTKRTPEGARIIPSIAVLPFVDLSPEKDQEYFSDGLAEELLSSMVKMQGLHVAARTSSFQFKVKNEDLRIIGQKLNVATVLEGSVRRQGQRIRISAQLVQVSDGFHLWSETFDRDLKDIFAVEDDVAKAVASALQLKLLAGRSPTTLTSSGTTNPETYEAFLHARYFEHMQDEKSARKALLYANKAIELDPNYAPAYALRASIELQSGGMVWMDYPEAIERARRDTEKAIALDPNLADAYRVLSMIQSWVESNCREAETSLKRAIDLAPGDPDNLGRSAWLAVCLGRPEKAVELWKQELLLDPLRPDEYLFLAQSLRDSGRHEEAHRALAEALDLNPNQISMIHEVGGEVYLAQGRPQEALAEIEKEPAGLFRDLGEALVYHALGRRQESDTALARMISQHSNDGGYQIVQVYAYRGEVDRAFEWLNRAYMQHDPGLMWFKTDLKLKSLRKDARYAQLLRKLNLPE
jgi:eukaryotic-like serine/threonine-protein kinase